VNVTLNNTTLTPGVVYNPSVMCVEQESHSHNLQLEHVTSCDLDSPLSGRGWSNLCQAGKPGATPPERDQLISGRDICTPRVSVSLSLSTSDFFMYGAEV